MKEESAAPAAGSPKHTPGPWTVLDARCGELWFIRAGDREVAETCGDNACANAKLIAAAPSLLSGLVAARDALDRYGTHEEGFWRHGTKFYLCRYADPDEPSGTPCNCGLHDALAAIDGALRAAVLEASAAQLPPAGKDQM